MIDIFEKYAPRWRSAVRDYARAVWNDEDDADARAEFNSRARLFAKRYRYALEQHYAARGMRVYRGTLDGKVKEWLTVQFALRDTMKDTVKDRQNVIIQREIERLQKEKSYTAQEALNKIYDARKNENVYKVFSFGEHYQDRAEQIGDDNAYALGTILNEGIIKEFSDRYIWATQRDKRVRKTHRKLQGKCFLFEDPPTEIFKNGKTHTGNPGTAWGCVPSGTRIRLDSDTIRCFRRKFTGELASIILESGISLSATGNHPVLTQRGWQPANLVNIGDYVFKVSDKSINRRQGNEYDAGIPVEKIFDFFSLCGIKESVPGSASQFHGDGIKEEKVDIITVDWELTNKRNSHTGEFIRKLIFSNSDMMSVQLLGASESEFYAAMRWLGLSSFGGVSGGGNFHSLFGRGILKADDVSLAAVSSFNSVKYQQFFNRVAAMLVSKVFHRASQSTYAGFITFDDFEAERVVDMKTTFYDGHVYNLQTATGWYIANGLSIHNCRCWAEIPMKPVKPLRHYEVKE